MVGGDIYWASPWGDGVLLCFGDCTGHGVPGAFMTLITTGAMNKALIETNEGDVGAFLQNVHQTVQVNLSQNQKTGESDDGMELGVCYFSPANNQMNFASARFDMLIVNQDEAWTIKPTRKGIGYRDIPFDQKYETHVIDLVPRMQFYLTSDGLIDQVGGERRRGFGKKRFKKLILSIHDLPFIEQRQRVVGALNAYQGAESRRDDILVVGFTVN